MIFKHLHLWQIRAILTWAVWEAAVWDVTWLFGLFAELHWTQPGRLGLKLRNIRRLLLFCTKCLFTLQLPEKIIVVLHKVFVYIAVARMLHFKRLFHCVSSTFLACFRWDSFVSGRLLSVNTQLEILLYRYWLQLLFCWVRHQQMKCCPQWKLNVDLCCTHFDITRRARDAWWVTLCLSCNMLWCKLIIF